MKIYTRKGDAGKTDVIGGRVNKDDPVIECLGAIDELAVAVMTASHYQDDEALKEDLHELANEFFALSAAVMGKTEALGDESVSRLEARIDLYQEKIKPLTGFVLPGETLPGSYLHAARVAARRLERRIVAYAREASITAAVLSYVNRLSDLLFVMARYAEENYVQ
ncbi:MAG TPA: cob(I)yrinic acid a,c-diamide adenosyltransferase [Acholeplasmataceae bacterium]|jgi:cob(I)alamin adenosyltransferase|nr:cob(I)yrinic acid a,c-diamide adenosyltransferase [Acholeplasmataceae bacterium]